MCAGRLYNLDVRETLLNGSQKRCILCLNAKANPDFVVDMGDLPPQGFFVYSSQLSAF